MKILEHILNTIIREQVSINNMQFGFMPGRSTTDTIFILRQLQEKYLQKKKNIYLAFVNLEKLLIVYLIEFFGEQCGNWFKFKLLSLCMTMLIWKSESQTAIATQLTFW